MNYKTKYWLFSLFFILLFGEIIGPTIAGNSMPLLQFPIYFLIYYAILTFVFMRLLFGRYRKSLVFGAMFVYGVIVEYVLFKNITDFKGVLFFGFFYVFLLGMPWYIYRKFPRYF